jgi:hypothetical protein
MSTVFMQKGNSAIALVEPLRQEIQNHLEKEKQRIFDEILHYPPPIPACDIQFNFLLEERSNITQELRRVREISERGASDFEQLKSLRKFVESSQYFDNVLTARLMSDLEQVLDICHQSTEPSQKL